MYKSLLEPEKYLSLKIPFFYRKAFAKFRCSNHKFLIETGRHLGIEHGLRYCIHCLNVENTRVIENEFHVFFNCAKFHEEPNMYLFLDIVEAEKKSILLI